METKNSMLHINPDTTKTQDQGLGGVKRISVFNLPFQRLLGGAIFAISSITSGPDLWLQERRRNDAAITVSVYKNLLGKRISRSEALRKASEILKHAEEERRRINEWESARGLQWFDS